MAYTSGRIFSGTKSIDTNAVQLHATQVCREVIVQNDSANLGNLLIGTATSQPLVITPGQSINLPVFSLGLIYVKMSSGTGTINWLARD